MSDKALIMCIKCSTSYEVDAESRQSTCPKCDQISSHLPKADVHVIECPRCKTILAYHKFDVLIQCPLCAISLLIDVPVNKTVMKNYDKYMRKREDDAEKDRAKDEKEYMEYATKHRPSVTELFPEATPVQIDCILAQHWRHQYIRGITHPKK